MILLWLGFPASPSYSHLFAFFDWLHSCSWCQMQLSGHLLVKCSLIRRENESLPLLWLLSALPGLDTHGCFCTVGHCISVTCLYIQPQKWTVCFLKTVTKMNVPSYHWIWKWSQWLFIERIINITQAKPSYSWAFDSQRLTAFGLVHIRSDSIKTVRGKIYAGTSDK